MPQYLFQELRKKGVIDVEDLYISNDAFFEEEELYIRISFKVYWGLEDMHIKALDYLVRKLGDGVNPITRGGNFNL